MILYFSGTGNSEYAAKRLGEALADETVSLFEKIRSRDFSALHSDSPWVVVTPTYAWRIPRIVNDWLEKTELEGSRDIFFAMTCGGDIGNAGKYLKALCESKKMNYRGCAEIVMPENYVAMFSVPNRDEALKIVDMAEAEIDKAAQLIKSGSALPGKALTPSGRLNSGIVNSAFYKLFVHAKKFYATDDCISCGKCVRLCPLRNISLQNGKPVWGDSCTHCMACICRCPSEAIEYGKASRGKPRYVCPKEK